MERSDFKLRKKVKYNNGVDMEHNHFFYKRLYRKVKSNAGKWFLCSIDDIFKYLWNNTSFKDSLLIEAMFFNKSSFSAEGVYLFTPYYNKEDLILRTQFIERMLLKTKPDSLKYYITSYFKFITTLWRIKLILLLKGSTL